MDIFDLLAFTVQSDASDLHINVNVPPMLRIHGEMTRVNTDPLSKERVHELVYDFMTDDQKKYFEEMLEIDFAREVANIGRFRVNIFSEHGGEGAVFRTIPTEIPNFEKLGLPTVLKTLASKEKGLILVTGPTGSGKSTTLAAMIDFINTNFKHHILTIEDPIEFQHQSKMSLVTHRELGTNTHSFANALRSALREDPDVILVGELRDLETTSLAITAAETGHLVFGTLHTISAAKTIDRIIDQFPADSQEQVRSMLSESLSGVISQTLLRRKDRKGRVGVYEILVASAAVRNLVREKKTFQLSSVMQTSAKQGMITHDQYLKNLVAEGIIDLEDAIRHAHEPSEFKKQSDE